MLRSWQNPINIQQTVYGQFEFPIYLGIDAIYIDQRNIEERSQVSLIYEICTKASTLIAWLGERDKYTVPALRMIYETFQSLELVVG